MAGIRVLGRAVAVLAALSGAWIAGSGIAGSGTVAVAGAGVAGVAGAGVGSGVWRPPERADWMWEIGQPLVTTNSWLMGTGVTAYNGDQPPRDNPVVYDIDAIVNSASTVAALHRRGDHVICYIEVGAAGNYYTAAQEGIRRSYYAQLKAAGDLGRWLPGYPERFININAPSAVAIIESMIYKQCAQKGFDAVETDLDETFGNNDGPTGFTITRADEERYLAPGTTPPTSTACCSASTWTAGGRPAAENRGRPGRGTPPWVRPWVRLRARLRARPHRAGAAPVSVSRSARAVTASSSVARWCSEPPNVIRATPVAASSASDGPPGRDMALTGPPMSATSPGSTASGARIG